MAIRPTMDFESAEVDMLISLLREAAAGNEAPKRVAYQDLCNRLIRHKQDLYDYRYSTSSRKTR